MPMHVMLDLETLSTRKNAAITAIGAVMFRFDTNEVALFYQTVDPVDCQRYGLHIEASTVMWWLKQSDEARAAIATDPVDLATALEGFRSWFDKPMDGSDPTETRVWANAPSFDCNVMDSAYEAIGASTPWSFRREMCFRTMKNLFKHVPAPVTETAHNALVDAENQVAHLREIMAFINGTTSAGAGASA